MFEFWLKNEKRDIDILLPVTPKSYEVDEGNIIETVRLTAVGDIFTPTFRRTLSLSIEGLFSVSKAPFVRKNSGMDTAFDYVTTINKWIEDKDIIRVIIVNKLETRINREFFIESLLYSEDNTTNGDINYKLLLKERKLLENKNTDESERTVTATSRVKTYTVKEGDYLKIISKKVYGDSSKWDKIYETNKSTIGNNPNIIIPGQILTIV